MYLAYFDESGDSGYENSTTDTFTLSAVIIHDADWLRTLDQVISFRRYLRRQFGLSTRAELKANWIIHAKGPFLDLGLKFRARMGLYEAAMRFQRKVGLIRSFAVVINKRKVKKRSVDPREWAWMRAIERLQSFGEAKDENVHILPDEGHGFFIRRLLRRMRRHHSVPSFYQRNTLRHKAVNIVGDCSVRKSENSYFIQFADLNAYAAFRRVFPGSNIGGGLWRELGEARIEEVNRLAGGPTGIVVWPT